MVVAAPPLAQCARGWRLRLRRRNASVEIVAPAERHSLKAGWKPGGDAASWLGGEVVMVVRSGVAVGSLELPKMG